MIPSTTSQNIELGLGKIQILKPEVDTILLRNLQRKFN